MRTVLQVHWSPSLPHSLIVLSSPHVANTYHQIDAIVTMITSPLGLQAQHQTLPECPFSVATARSLISAITNMLDSVTHVQMYQGSLANLLTVISIVASNTPSQ